MFLELLIKTKNHLAYWNFNVSFEFPDNLLQDANTIFQKSVDNFCDSSQNVLNFGLGCSSSLGRYISFKLTVNSAELMFVNKMNSR